jgi:hypothetical protein
MKILLLRVSYWTAAVADFCIAGLVLMPEKMGLERIEYPMGLTSAIAMSWGIPLLMVDRRPLDRKWILIPTIIVVAALITVRTIFALKGFIPFSFFIFVFGLGLSMFMTFSYFYALKSEDSLPAQRVEEEGRG